MTLLTAKDLARQVAGSAYDEDLVFRRVRHWTIEGLLATADELNPGRGRSRHYSPSTLTKAKTLNRLTDAGVSVVTLRAASIFMDTADFSRLSSKFGPLYLAIKKIHNKEVPELSLFSSKNDQERPVYTDSEYTILVKLG